MEKWLQVNDHHKGIFINLVSDKGVLAIFREIGNKMSCDQVFVENEFQNRRLTPPLSGLDEDRR